MDGDRRRHRATCVAADEPSIPTTMWRLSTTVTSPFPKMQPRHHRADE
jgi:hypothetical protein